MPLVGRKARFALATALALLLAACGGTGPTPPTGVTVNGLVVDLDDQPLPGLLVFIPGQPTEVSGADGTFAFDDITTPYDLTVVDPTTDFAHTYVGLTTDSPTIQPLGAQLQATSRDFGANVSGDLLHATLSPLPANHEARVCVEGIGRVILGCSNLTTGATFNVFPRWSGNTSATVRLRVVVYETDANGEATTVVATGVTSNFPVTEADVLVGQDVTIVEETEQESISVTASVPPGFTLRGRQLIATYSDYASLGIASDVGPAATFTVVAPVLPGATHTLLTQALNDDTVAGNTSIAWRALVDPLDPVSLELPTPPSLVSPADLATGVDLMTQFTVNNPEGGVLTFLFQPQPPEEGPSIAVTTSQTATTIPDLAALGVPFPTDADYMWVLLSTPDLAATDEAVTGGGVLGQFVTLALITEGGAPAPDTDGRISTSPSREFHTDP